MSKSLSKIPVKIHISGLGEAGGELVRYYAPLTVEEVLRHLPIDGRAYPIKGGLSMIVGIKRGVEKPTRKVEFGTITYWPMSNSICFFHSSTLIPSPMNKIGKITENIDLIAKIPIRSRVKISKL